jgi:hypothetical protein
MECNDFNENQGSPPQTKKDLQRLSYRFQTPRGKQFIDKSLEFLQMTPKVKHSKKKSVHSSLKKTISKILPTTTNMNLHH